VGAAHPVLPINDQRCTMHISTGRADSGRSLRSAATSTLPDFAPVSVPPKSNHPNAKTLGDGSSEVF